MKQRSVVKHVLPLALALGALWSIAVGTDMQCTPIPVDPPEVTCFSNADCLTSDIAAGQYCAKDLGDCDGEGVCEDRPTQNACPRLWAPVCGCDDETYANDCEAAVAGVSVAYEGPCEFNPGECWSNEDCAPFYGDAAGDPAIPVPMNMMFCAKDDCDGPGVCQSRPADCLDVWEPVCGCDGRTYGNACDANAAGVNVDYEGECETEPTDCWSNQDCPAFYGDDSGDPSGAPSILPMSTMFCSKDAGDCDGPGVCELMPEVCIDLWAPVCGCNGQTYSNSCFAHGAGVNVAYEGECETEPQSCQSNSDCLGNLPPDYSINIVAMPVVYCAKHQGECGGEGVCEERPWACPDVWQPVCGCNDQVYGNGCEAAAAGVNVAYEGECLDD